jgi:hypothetical protein
MPIVAFLQVIGTKRPLRVDGFAGLSGVAQTAEYAADKCEWMPRSSKRECSHSAVQDIADDIFTS